MDSFVSTGCPPLECRRADLTRAAMATFPFNPQFSHSQSVIFSVANSGFRPAAANPKLNLDRFSIMIQL